MDASLKKKLRQAKKNWKSARERVDESGDFTEIPDGRYIAQLTDAVLTESQSSGRAQIQWTWTVKDGEFTRETKLDFDGLETEDNLVFLGRKLRKLGKEIPDDLMEIESLLGEIVDESLLCRIRLRTKGEFQNVYIDKVMGSASEDEEEADEEDAESESEDADTDDAGEDEEPEDEEPEDEDDSDEAEEEDEDEVEVEIGMRVIAFTNKGEEPGEIVGVVGDGEDAKVRVKLDSGRSIRVTADKIEAEPEKAPPKKKRRSKK